MTVIESPLPHQRRRRALRWAGALGLTGVLTGTGYQSWSLFERHQIDSAAQTALNSARDYAVTLTTADPTTIDAQIARIIDGSTGEFHDRYAKHSAELRAIMLANKVTTRGEVIDSAVKAATIQTASALLVVQQTFTSTDLPAPAAGQPDAPDVTSMAVTLQKVDGRWLVSNVVPAQQNSSGS